MTPLAAPRWLIGDGQTAPDVTAVHEAGHVVPALACGTRVVWSETIAEGIAEDIRRTGSSSTLVRAGGGVTAFPT